MQLQVPHQNGYEKNVGRMVSVLERETEFNFAVCQICFAFLLFRFEIPVFKIRLLSRSVFKYTVY